MDGGFLTTLTGHDNLGTPKDIREAVAKRFVEIKPTLREKSGDYIYHGNRCEPTNLGWRVIQDYQLSEAMKDHELKGIQEIPLTPENILAGKLDKLIEFTWHNAASAEHWYTFEKDWGYGPGMGPFGDD